MFLHGKQIAIMNYYFLVKKKNILNKKNYSRLGDIRLDPGIQEYNVIIKPRNQP